MITISLVLMFILFIAAGATQFWLLAMIGVGIFLATLLMYVMATNDVFSSIVVMLAAIAAPLLYLTYEKSWILFVFYIVIGLWINSDTINAHDVYSEWTLEGKIYLFWEERATDFLVKLFSAISAVIWGVLAWVGTRYHWFLVLPTLYLVVRSLLIIIKSREYSLRHSFTFFEDIGDFFASILSGIKSLFTFRRSYGRTFSKWNMILPILVAGLSIALIFLESDKTYTNFAKDVELFNLFDSTKWFYFTAKIWNYIPEVCEEMSRELSFLGDLLNIPLALLLFIATVLVAAVEAVLSLLWLLVCLIADEIIPFIIGGLLLYVVPFLLPIALLVFMILSFKLDHAIANCVCTVVCFLIGIVGCYYYVVSLSGMTPIVPLPF